VKRLLDDVDSRLAKGKGTRLASTPSRPRTITAIVARYLLALVEREGSYDAAAKKLGLQRQALRRRYTVRAAFASST